MLTTTKTRVDTYLDVHVTVDKSVDVTVVECNLVFFAKGRFVLAEHVRNRCRRKLPSCDDIFGQYLPSALVILKPLSK